MFDATIITSLPPVTKRMVAGRDFGSVYQRACIESWSSAGFRVVSVNSAAEIDLLKPLDYNVTYVASLNARPAIAEFMKIARESRDEFVGITNADCFFLGYPAFIGGIRKGVKRGVVAVERVNIDPVSLLPTGQTCLGFDAFFFTPAMAHYATIPPHLVVGQPWWDYWFPAAFVIANVKFFRPQSPLIFHLDHEQGWSQERWLASGRSFLKALNSVDEDKCPQFLSGARAFAKPETLELDDLGGFGDWCFNWLRDNAHHLEVSTDTTAAELLGRILAAVTNFDGMHANTLALAQAHQELARLTASQSRPPPYESLRIQNMLAGADRPLWFRLVRALLKGV